jgi:hypothetical protein
MKPRLYYSVVISLLLLFISLIACRTQTSSTTAADREALAAVVKEIDSAYNAQDATRFSAVFAEDGNFQFPVEGIELDGRDEIKGFPYGHR